MTPFHLHRANFCQVKDNTIYPIEEAITDLDSFKRTVSYDYVMSKHRNDHRSNDDFIESDVPIMDVDETKSLVDFETAMQGKSTTTATSRHHQQWKHAQAPCDRFHSYFPIPKVTDQVVLVRLLADMHKQFPFTCSGPAEEAMGWLRGQYPDREIRILQNGDSDYEAATFFLLDTAQSIVKIGSTENVARRMTSSLGLFNPRNGGQRVLLGCITGNTQVEHALHRLLDDYRAGGEWFYFREYARDVVESILQLRRTAQIGAVVSEKRN